MRIGEGELAAPVQLRIFNEFTGGAFAIYVETLGKVAAESRSRAAPREDGAALAAAVGAQHIVDIIAEVTRLNWLRRYPAKTARVDVEHRLAAEWSGQGAEGELRRRRIEIGVDFGHIEDGVIEILRRQFGQRVSGVCIDHDEIGYDALRREQGLEQNRVRLAVAITCRDDRVGRL